MVIQEENVTNYGTDVHVRPTCGHKVLWHLTSKEQRNADGAVLTSLLVLLQKSVYLF